MCGPCLHGLCAPSSQAQAGAPDSCSLSSPHQLSTSVLPSSGEKQPVTVGLLWIQQAALFLPILKRYKKQQSGQVTASWEGSHKSGAQRWGEATESLHRTYCCVCSVGVTYTLSQTTSTHTNTHVHIHISKPHRSAEVVKCTPASHKYLQVFREGGPRND